MMKCTSPLYATAVGLVMDGLKRNERKKAEDVFEEETVLEDVHFRGRRNRYKSKTNQVKERRSFLDKLNRTC